MCKGDSNTTLAKDNRVQRTEYRCRRGGTGVSALKRTEYNRVGASLVGAQKSTTPRLCNENSFSIALALAYDIQRVTKK